MQKKSFLDLYDEYYPKLYAYVLVRVRERALTEDIVQQSFLKALENFQSYRPRFGATFGSWLFTIAKNEFIDRTREKKKLLFVEREDLDAIPATSEIVESILRQEQDQERWQLWQKVLTSFDQLSDGERELITLKYLADLPYEDIAKIMGKRPNTLAVMLRRSLEKIRKDVNV